MTHPRYSRADTGIGLTPGMQWRCVDVSACVPRPMDATELLLVLSEWLPGITPQKSRWR
jgi:hypothetical protein